MNTRYHTYLGDRRTTASLDNTLAALLALKLRKTPETLEAHNAVRTWLQARIDEKNDPDRVYVSQWLQSEALLFLVDKRLSERYWDWRLGET